MSYGLNDDQRRIQELVRRVAQERVVPRAPLGEQLVACEGKEGKASS